MSRKLDTIDDIEAIAEKAHRGEDVSEHFTGRHAAKQRVNVDFPLSLLRMIDADCELIGISRQAWIKMACDERLRQIQAGREREKRIRQWEQQEAEGYARIPAKLER